MQVTKNMFIITILKIFKETRLKVSRGSVPVLKRWQTI